MSEQPQDFATLMQRVRDGSEEAVRELLETYGNHIYRAVRRRLNQQLRSRFDSQDFVQAVWTSFFAHRSVVLNFAEPQALVAYLARIAGNKVIEQCRRRMSSQKDAVNREQSIESFSFAGQVYLSSSDPTASQVAIANEQWNRFVEGQPAHYQQMLELRSSGATFAEIAEATGMNERTVRRVIQKLSERIDS